jgi:cytochrome P450
MCTTVQDMFTAGSDTTASLLEWAMAELINHPDEMHKLQEEIRMAVHAGGENQVTEDHLGMLRHLKSVLKETLRLHTPAPLVRREAVEDTELLGYHVPAGTRVLMDIGAIAQDPAMWERAGEFVPERWLRDDGAAVADHYAAAGHDFTFLPFGGGRRRCPGVGFGMANAEIVLASLLYHFDWELPAGGPSTVDMDEVSGLVVRLKKPLCLVAKPWSP